MISSISSLDIISVVVLWPEPKIFLCIPASAADAAVVNPNGMKTLLANALITFFINGNPVFSSNGLRSLIRNPPDCIVFGKWVFDSLILAGELLAKTLRRFATCLLVINNLCGKLVSLSKLPTIFDDNLKITLVSFLLQTLTY